MNTPDLVIPTQESSDQEKCQYLFDRIVRHLRTQQRKALRSDGKSCSYLSPNGDRCAVGCLIEPEHYTPEVEGRGIHFTLLQIVLLKSLPWLRASEFRQAPALIPSLLNRMQEVHDDEELDNWEYCWESIAERHSLKYTAPEAQ